MTTRFDEAVYVANDFQAKRMILSTGCVSNAHVDSDAAIESRKMQHRHRKSYFQSGTAVSATVPIHVVQGEAASCILVMAGTITACTGNATIEVDVKKNNVSILADKISLDSSNQGRILESANISDDDAQTDDWFDVVVTVAAGTGALGTGLLVEVEFDEDAT